MKNRKNILLTYLVSLIPFIFVMHISAATIDEIIEKLEENQEKTEDISADVVMEIDVAGRVIVQESKMWSKGEKTRIEIKKVQNEKLTPLENDSLTGQEGKTETTFPMTIIMGADKMTIRQADRLKTEDHRPKTTDLIALNGKMGDFLRKSEVTIIKEEGNEVTLSVIPEEANPLMQKLDMVVDMERGVITQQKMYSNMGISFCRMEYESKHDVWVLKKFTMTSNLGQMGTSTVKAEYKNVKINKGIEDEMFE